MKKVKISGLLFGLVCFIFSANTAEAQFGKKLKEKMAKAAASKGGKGVDFSDFNAETDEMGVTGQYFELADGKSYGFKFMKEVNGELANQLFYYEKKGEPTLKMEMKESAFRKHQIKLFYKWHSASAESYIELVQLADGVFAQTAQKSSYNNPGIAPLTNKRTVKNVYAKDKAEFETWDMETAQAKIDMVFGTLKGAESEKIQKKLMKYEVYKNYKGKVAFAKVFGYLKHARQYQLTEKPANFITKRELGEDLIYKPYFEKPLSVSHPGAIFNITYEMLGETTDREALRKTSKYFQDNMPTYDASKKDPDLFYFRFPISLLDNRDNAADWGFIELLRKVQGKLKKGETYKFKLTVWAHRDGENLEAISTGTVELNYGDKTQALLLGPDKGWITMLEEGLDE